MDPKCPSHIRRRREMQTMVEDFSLNLPKFVSIPKATPYKVVVLTGTTGKLGSMLLADLISDQSVSTVYALNRDHKHPLTMRQREAFREKGIDEKLLNSDKLRLLVGDVLKSDFDLPSEVFREMKDSVTHIIHNAWPTALNPPLSFFKPSMEGLRNLLDFAMSSGAMFTFISSAIVFNNADMGEKFLEQPIPAHYALGYGYSESKWVGEQIVLNARANGLPTQSIRVGHLCGFKTNGSWSKWEWPTAMINSAKWLRCIPTFDRTCSWMYTEWASRAIVDSLDGGGKFPVLHLNHPNPVPWSIIANEVSSALGAETVTFSEWFARLQKYKASHGRDRSGNLYIALRLLPFLETFVETTEAFGDHREAFGLAAMNMENTLKVCPSLSNPLKPGLGKRDARQWLVNLEERQVEARL
ncbi:hypothetical protein V5O48_002018 [Marasmius crinis-equi]|uniref:Thioester reductase (TE) domain-containing protein n=1 Tax=Marasmius crinis-equi TaxID=585013 RepID=A0ABR3FX99_9AGAR